MARRPNAYASDPNLRDALGSIASMFAPPSGSDVAGYAAADLNATKRKQLEEFYRMASDPNASREVVDRYGVASGAFNPTQSYYKIGVDSADTRRSQDITAATSAANNIRDNQRAVVQTRYGDLKEGDTRVAMPGSVAGMYSLPEQPEQRGMVKLGQNQTATLPDGTTMSGINRPQTMDEWTAQNAERQRQAGVLPDTTITDIIMGKQAPVVALGGADGKTPIYTTPGTAARMQMPAAAAPSSAPVNRSEGTAYVDGKPVAVTRAPDGLRWQLPDGSPVPDNVPVQNMVTPQSAKDANPTEFSDKNAIFYSRAAPASQNINDLMKAGYQPSARDFELMLGKAGDTLPLSLTNNLVSPEGRQFYNSAMNFMLSVLRPDTGAAFGKEEFQNYAKVFIPLPGDDPQTLSNKASAREAALLALQGTSRGGADKIVQLFAQNGLQVPPEMARRMAATQPGMQAAQPGAMGGQGGPNAAGTDALGEARSAIQRGAPREAVIQRLRGMGIDPGGL